MIYRDGYLKKEMHLTESKGRFGRRVFFGLFLGLFSFAVFFALQTLQESVIAEKAPQIMQRSLFSTITIYLYVSFLGVTGYLLVYFDSLFFSEIRRNTWYMLIKMGYQPYGMIASKLAAQSYAVLAMYVFGFAATTILTVFIKAPFVYAYMPSLFITGMADLMLITVFCMTASLFVSSAKAARYLIICAAVLILLLKAVLGMNDVISDRAVMQTLSNVVRESAYLPACAGLIVLGIIVCVIRARNLSKYVNTGTENALILKGAAVGYADEKTGQIIRADVRSTRQHKAADAIVTIVLIIIIGAALALNLFIILIGTATPGSEVTISGSIPYVFRSDTMEPDIMLNDLVFFKRVDGSFEPKKNDIVLFKYHDAVYVERIHDINGESVTVDIDAYPQGSQQGAMVKTIDKNAVYGVYSGKNRWLGALILFANSIVGRIVFLLVPAVLLFFRKQIAKAAGGGRGDE